MRDHPEFILVDIPELKKPSTTIPFSKAKIDWSKTKAWGDGGYYARIFLNVAGREPEGTISKNDYEKVRDELIAGLKSISDENGRPIGTMVFVQRNFTSTCAECA